MEVCLVWKAVLLRLLVVRVVAVVSTVTRSLVVVAGLHTQALHASKRRCGSPETSAINANPAKCDMATKPLDPHCEDCQSGMSCLQHMGSVRKLLLLLVFCARNTNAMRDDVLTKFAVMRVMLA